MLHKKHTVKEVQSIGKSDAKKLKANVVAIIGEEFDDVLDAVWEKKGAVSRRRWQFGPGSSAVLYLVNDVPLVVGVDGFPSDAEGLFPKNAVKGKLVPTVFFFLRAHHVLEGEPQRLSSFLSKAAVNVFCRGPTSRFLLSGAHLMIPGIVAADKGDSPPGSLAVISSVGTETPYAVGLTTSGMVSGDPTGVGVYVINCFKDSLWYEFAATFVTSCTDKSRLSVKNPVPTTFCEDEVEEVLPRELYHEESTTAAEEKEGAGEAAPSVAPDSMQASEFQDCGEGEAHVSNGSGVVEAEQMTGDATETAGFEELFGSEDDVLSFAFFEALKTVQASMMPLPLAQFTAMVVNAYPRVNQEARAIDFKSTKFKRALTFLKQFTDVVEIHETSAGVYSIVKVDKSSILLRNHNRKFKDFLAQVQRPAKEKESRAAEMRLLEDKKTVFNQQIVSVETNYRLHRNTSLPEDLVRVLLEGSVAAIVERETRKNMPTLEMEKGLNGSGTMEELPPINEDVYLNLHPRKTIAGNLRAYVKTRELLVIPDGAGGGKGGGMPSVRLLGALSAFQPDGGESLMPLNSLEKVILKRHFSLVTEIIVQTSVSGSAAMSEFIPPRYITKNGRPPRVNVWTEKRSGNKAITILKNMAALGFDLDILCRAWRQRFATSCSVFDPASEMQNLKSGTKIPVEIHIQGDITRKLTGVLTKELGIPSGLISHSK